MSFSPGYGSHEEGHVAVCYSEDGRHIITGGSEGDINIYKGTSNTENPVHTFFADAFNVSKVEQWDDNLVAASEGWSLQKWGFPDGNKSGFLGKFAGNITHFSLNFDRDKILVGSAEFTMKITDLESDRQSTIKGHTAPILRTSFGKKFFASSSCDGTLKVWDTETKECLKTFDLYPKSNDVDLSKVRGAIQFDRQENLIAAKENEIIVYSSSTWAEKTILILEEMKNILEIEFSHCGRCLVVGCKDGSIFIWDLLTNSCINKLKCVSTPSSIATHPFEYKMLVGDLKGKWRQCEGYLTSAMLPAAPASKDPATNKDIGNFFDLEAADLEDWDEDEGQDIMNIEREEDEIRKPSSRSSAAILNDDEDSNEPSILQMAKLPERSTSPPPPALLTHVPEQPAQAETELQEAFQVSSSPEHLSYRYLVWNNVGLITSNLEDDTSYINIEFHDSTTHHPLHMMNSEGYTLGSLSKTAFALATTITTDEKSSCSKLSVNVFSSWSATKEWSVSLPKEESAVLLSLSNTHVVVVTDMCYVRVWSVGGLQGHVLSLPGDPVTAASHNNMLSVAHYAGFTLSYSLYDIKKVRLVYSGALPVTPSATLSWMGFTEGALPLVYDSEGVLRALLPHSGLVWVPLSDLRLARKNLSDTYWVIAGGDDTVKCVLCRGVTYPGIAPRPMVTLLPHTLPLCDSGSERTTLEQGRLLNWVKSYNLNKLNTFQKECKAETIEKDEITLLLKLMALAIKNNKDFKAFEIAKMMPTKQSLEMSSRYASKTGRTLLAQKINEVLRSYEDSSEEEDDIFEITDVSYTPEPFMSSNEPKQTASVSSVMSMAKKRISQIDESVAPLRLKERPPTPSSSVSVSAALVEEAPSSEALITSSDHSQAEVNPFSVKSNTIQNTQRRSTSFLESIESKGLQVEQKRKSMQKVLEKPSGLSLADLGKKSSFQKVTKASVQKMPTKRSKPKTKKITGYSLWFAEQAGLEAKQGPLKWRHLSADVKQKWLDQAKELETQAPAPPSISLTNSFKKVIPSEKKTHSDAVSDKKEKKVEEDSKTEEEDDDQKENKEINDGQKENKEINDNQKENKEINDDQKENKEIIRAVKRKASSESESEEANPAKTKKITISDDVAPDTKSKLAAFQFKKKS